MIVYSEGECLQWQVRNNKKKKRPEIQKKKENKRGTRGAKNNNDNNNNIIMISHRHFLHPAIHILVVMRKIKIKENG